MTDGEIEQIARFIASLDATVPYRLIGFRPNNVLYYHPGPSHDEMERLCEVCREAGLTDVAWSGYYPEAVPDAVRAEANRLKEAYGGDDAAALESYHQLVGRYPETPVAMDARIEMLAALQRLGRNQEVIDTAPAYGAGHSEDVIGRALEGCRDDWIVCTKGGHGATDGVAGIVSRSRRRSSPPGCSRRPRRTL